MRVNARTLTPRPLACSRTRLLHSRKAPRIKAFSSGVAAEGGDESIAASYTPHVPRRHSVAQCIYRLPPTTRSSPHLCAELQLCAWPHMCAGVYVCVCRRPSTWAPRLPYSVSVWPARAGVPQRAARPAVVHPSCAGVLRHTRVISDKSVR